MRRLWLIFAQATTVALAVMFVLATLRPAWLPRHEATAAPLVLTTVAAPVSGPASGPAHPGFSQAARRAAPAVVSIRTSMTATADPATEDLMKRWHRDVTPTPRDMRRMMRGLGSGVIVSPDGYLLTNNHVVEHASEIEVTLNDGRQAQARLIGTDAETDLALLKIKLDHLPVIQWGNAETLEVGDVVLAIGNPFNVGQTVTSGIVSALGRTQQQINTFAAFIQTDAAINPGNSGGALVDGQGNLVGINTAIFSRGGGSMGIGFAIPITLARQVMEALLRDGQVARGYIGVETSELTPEFAQAYKLPLTEGLLVSRVKADAPAAKAGLKPGDVLIRIGSKAVLTQMDLLTTVAALKPASDTTVTLQRGTRQMELKVKVGLRPPPPPEDDPTEPE